MSLWVKCLSYKQTGPDSTVRFMAHRQHASVTAVLGDGGGQVGGQPM